MPIDGNVYVLAVNLMEKVLNFLVRRDTLNDKLWSRAGGDVRLLPVALGGQKQLQPSMTHGIRAPAPSTGY